MMSVNSSPPLHNKSRDYALGHKDLRMTSHYAHLSDDHLQQAVKSLDLALDSSTVIDTLRVTEGETR
jgi:Arc/MetJ family transcription regulator